MSETYWRCPRCEVVVPTPAYKAFETSLCGKCYDEDGLRVEREQCEVHPVGTVQKLEARIRELEWEIRLYEAPNATIREQNAALTRLRAMEARLRDDGTACVIHRVSTADAIDAYRLAVLGEEAT